VFNDSVLPILEAKQDMLVDGNHDLGNGLTIEPAPGHSPGHIVIKLQSRGSEALFIGDVMHNPIQIHYRRGAAPSAPIPSRPPLAPPRPGALRRPR